MHNQIFYDPKQQRKGWFNKIITLSITIFAVTYGLLLYSLVRLPSPNSQVASSDSKKASQEFKNVEYTDEELFSTYDKLANINDYADGELPPPPKISKNKTTAFLVNWDRNSFNSLKLNIDKIDFLIPEWYRINPDDLTISVLNPKVKEEISQYIKSYRPSLAVVPIIHNFSEKYQDWDKDLMHDLLNQPARFGAFASELADLSRDNGYKGFTLDLENIPISDQPKYADLIKAISLKFKDNNLLLYVALPPDGESYDYPKIAEYVDKIIFMNYDEHWSNSAPGPIASYQWFRENLVEFVRKIDPKKISLALGAYGYDWGDEKVSAKDLTYTEVIDLSRSTGSQIYFDPNFLNPYLHYTDDKKIEHEVWFLDSVSAFNQIKSANKLGVSDFSIWRLGSEDPSIWPILDSYPLNKNATKYLEDYQYGDKLIYRGVGEILSVASLPSSGRRLVEYDSGLELVIKVDYQTLPTTLDIVRKGGSDDKKINLTFDDGPDGVYTPQILDILKKYNIKATFFTVGNNIEDNLSIVKRIIQEGHEIGNHTFTHPNISHLSQRQLGFELNAHNLLLQSLTGRGSLLFRPPFDIDSEPQFVREALSIKTAAESGYQIVSMNVDPKDWMNPGTSEIVNRTIDGVDSGLGKVILLHDSGGDRSQTVSALPQIIEKLQAGGYQFVPTSELLGMTRDQVMPKVSSYDLTSSYINFVGFFGISLFMKIITAIFYFGLFLGVGRALIIGTLAIIEKLQSKFPPRHSHGLSTAVIIPAYNEGKVICKTIDSVLASEYKDFQILVINDGSSDNTSKTVSKKYGRNRRVILMDKPNTGKSDSINYGLKHTHADIVIIIDADTIFDRYTIPRLVRHFSDPNIAAVAGNAKVGNRSNLLTRIQAVEYITAQNLDRRAFSLLNCMTVVPGAVGAWRRQPLLDIGGVSTDTLAEDADATVALIRQGYKLAYDPLAYAYTEAPPTFETFMKQRFRWMFGNFQVAWKHRDTLFNPRYGLLGFVAFPNVIVFQIFFPLVSPFVDLYTLYILILGIANKINHPQLADLSYLWMTLEYYLAFLLLDLLVSFLAFCLERKEDFSLIFWIVIQRLFYRQLIYFTAIKAIITALHGKPVGWNKFERFGTVKRK